MQSIHDLKDMKVYYFKGEFINTIQGIMDTPTVVIHYIYYQVLYEPQIKIPSYS